MLLVAKRWKLGIGSLLPVRKAREVARNMANKRKIGCARDSISSEPSFEADSSSTAQQGAQPTATVPSEWECVSARVRCCGCAE